MFYLVLTVGLYAIFQALQSMIARKKGGIHGLAPLFHPVLLSAGGIILFLVATGGSYEEYRAATEGITFFLGPAVVALGVPLYVEWKKLRSSLPNIALTVTFGSLIGIGSSLAPALLLEAPLQVLYSLAPRSVTTPIAMAIAERAGGIPALSAVVVVATGIFGAITGPVVLRFLGWAEESVVGISLGVASHGIGTARALELGETAGAYSALALCLNGILTSILVPLLRQVIV